MVFDFGLVRSIREGYQVLRANGVPITPGNHRVFEWLPESFLLFLMRRMVKAETTAIKLGHAAQGRAEWQRLADEFRSLVNEWMSRRPPSTPRTVT